MLARFDHRTPTWFPIHVWGPQPSDRRQVRRQSETASSASPASGEASFDVRFDVHENQDAYVLSADVPGVKETDLDITVEKRTITVAGERKGEHESADAKSELRSRERGHGRFSRTFRLRDSIDAGAVSAELSNGVLTLTVPKAAEAKPRTIPVTVK